MKISSKNLKKKKDKTDYARLDAMKDADINTTDIPELGNAFWRMARLLRPGGPRKPVTLRMDENLLDWFKKQGGSYQAHMHAVLKAYAEAQRKEP